MNCRLSGLPRRAVASWLALALVVSGCQSISFERDGVVPTAIRPANGSPARTALNAQVYDAAVGHVEQLFYRHDFGGVDFAGEAAARRARAIAQPDEDGFYAEVEALLDVVDDDHTYSLSPTERDRRNARDAGERRPEYGFGASPEGDLVIVESVRSGSPAQAAGVLPGWRVQSVDGRPALVAAPPQADRSDIIVFVDENGVSHTLTLTPVMMDPRPRFVTRRLDHDIAYIRFDGFDQALFARFQAEISALAITPSRGLIIDLRGNRGGSLSLTGRSLAQLFDRRIDFVVTMQRSRRLTSHVDPSPTPYLGPLVIVVGPGSGSGGELFPAVAQELGRAVIVGRTTRGAVIGTRGINLPDGGLLNVGMIDMTTPGGKRLEKAGVTPDVVVETDWLAVRQGLDPTLDAAVVALEGQIARPPSVATARSASVSP